MAKKNDYSPSNALLSGKTLFILLLLIFSVKAAAQDDTLRSKAGKRFISFGAGLSGQSFYDQAISFVKYKRMGVSPHLGWLKWTGKRSSRLDGSFLSLSMSGGRGSDLIPMEVNATKGQVTYTTLWKFRDLGNGVRWDLGFHANLLFVLKLAPQLDNSQIVYDYALGVGPTSSINKEFTFKEKKLRLLYQLSIPLLAHISRPPYLNRVEFIDPEDDLLVDFIDNSQIASLGNYAGISSLIELYYPIRGSNYLRISYCWDFYTMKTEHTRVWSIENQYNFSLLFNM